MSDEIMNTICEDVAAMIQRTRPCFGNIVVGDINDENTGLLEKAISGDSRAERDLILMVERQRAQKRAVAAETAKGTGMDI